MKREHRDMNSTKLGSGGLWAPRSWEAQNSYDKPLLGEADLLRQLNKEEAGELILVGGLTGGAVSGVSHLEGESLG